MKIQKELDVTSDLSRESTDIMITHKDISNIFEEGVENEISVIINNHDNIIYKERSTLKHFAKENDILKKSYRVLMKDCDDINDTIYH